MLSIYIKVDKKATGYLFGVSFFIYFKDHLHLLIVNGMGAFQFTAFGGFG